MILIRGRGLMTFARRSLACLGCCALWLMASPAVVLADSSSSAGSGEGTAVSSLPEGPLVAPGSPLEGEQARAAEEAKLANPEAVAEREASRTKYEGLDAEQATRVAGEAFPVLIDDPAGGPPKLPIGQSIVGYPTDDAAQVDLPEGRYGVVESTAPFAVETSPNQRTPVDLSLSEAAGAFEPKTPVVGVRISKRLSGGLFLAGTGVSLTPVDARGSSLGGSEGAIDGATVFFANTQTDMDTVVKATTFGFEVDTMLRSVESPQQLSFRVGLPTGATLTQATSGSGSVQVIDEGAVVASVLAPTARDAEGTRVPVSMSVSGDTITLAVDDHSGEYDWPIAV